MAHDDPRSKLGAFLRGAADEHGWELSDQGGGFLVERTRNPLLLVARELDHLSSDATIPAGKLREALRRIAAIDEPDEQKVGRALDTDGRYSGDALVGES